MFIIAILILISALTFAKENHDQLERKLFGIFDENGDCYITEQEHGVQIMSFDADKDTLITKDEFSAGVDKMDRSFLGHEDALFRLLDHDSDGNVDMVNIDNIFEVVDLNGDGHVDHQEFHMIFQLVVTKVRKGWTER